MSKKLDFAVHFADMARLMKITPRALADLVTLANKRCSAETRLCNEPDPHGKIQTRCTKIANQLADMAHELGFQVEYNGLYPTFVNADGRNFHVPN